MRILVRNIWSPPGVLGVRGSSGKRSRWVRQPSPFVVKSELRAVLRARRRAFVSARGSNQFNSDTVTQCFDRYLEGKQKTVASYRASAEECDVNSALCALVGIEDRLALPWANSKADPIVFRRWRPGGALEVSPLGFEQPLETGAEVAPDIILTPLLGFDRTLRRLGQGAGHYDRAFALFPNALRIGIAWSCQQIDAIPADPWDMPLDAVLTEREWITAPQSRLDPQP